LQKFIKPANQPDVKRNVLEALQGIRDHEGKAVSLIERVPDAGDVWRVKPGLVSSYKRADTGYESPSVQGIIIKADAQVMRTDGVIVDSLLGQGNALDDYLLKLQQDKNRRQQVEIELSEMEIKKGVLRQDIIANRDSEAAALFEKLYSMDQPIVTED